MMELRYGVKGVRAAMDGTHVRIRTPSIELSQAYFNKDGYHSIILHAVCDVKFAAFKLFLRFIVSLCPVFIL
jgi:hypothetical protein